MALIDLCNDSVRRKSSKQQPGYSQAADVEEAKHYPLYASKSLGVLGKSPIIKTGRSPL